MGKFLGTLFTLGIGIVIGMSLPKDTLQKVHLPELPKIKALQNKSNESAEPVVKATVPKKEIVTTKVAKAEVPVVKATEPVAAVESKSNLYTVQIASFAKRKEAEGYVDRMNQQQVDAYIAPSDLSQNKNAFRVFVGEYTTRQDALAKQQSLAKRFKDAFVQNF